MEDTVNNKLSASEELEAVQECYIPEDSLHKHIQRQSAILQHCLAGASEITPSLSEIGAAFEKALFAPNLPPGKTEQGTMEKEPKLNFYPTFMLPETLATYHIFFQNLKVPLSIRANRPGANRDLYLKTGASLPDFPTVEEVSKIYEGLGQEQVADHTVEKSDTVLVELRGDNPRLAVAKRQTTLTHAAYPAITLPPQVMSCILENLVIKSGSEQSQEGGVPVVSDELLAKWLAVSSENRDRLETKRKAMMGVTMVSLTLECMHRFFTAPTMIKKLAENLHYMFRHGYVEQACETSNVELTTIVSYLGMLHENRLGQSVLHKTLSGEARMDYVRDTIYLYLVYTWQSAMGVWKQCLEETNLKELAKILQKDKKALWLSEMEKVLAENLANVVFPEKLLSALQNALPDFTSQSMMQNFRSFILERSGILPALSTLLPSDFVPLKYKECPPPMWSYTYLLRLANYLMYFCDLAEDHSSSDGVLSHYCRCNLCTPHRCIATNPALANEMQLIGAFEMQGPNSQPFKLTPGLWTTAYLKKFEEADFFPRSISYYEDRGKANVEPTACVITQPAIVAQLQTIKKAREQFLLTKGHGVYLDPQTGEELNTGRPTVDCTAKHGRKSGQHKRSKRVDRKPPSAGTREPLGSD